MNEDNRRNAQTTQAVIPAGVWPTMITPFTDDGAIDWAGLDELVDWYIEAGVAGLFAVCLSSEMYELSPEERLQLAHGVVDRASERVPVVAAGAFGQTVDDQLEMVARLYETGVEAVVLTVNQLAGEEESDDAWQRRAEKIFRTCESIPLGLYECPSPYHRTLPPNLLQWAARSERVVFYKDTCCSLPEICSKLAVIEGTTLAWFNAHAPTLLESLRAGGKGYSSIGANFIPRLYVWLCDHYEQEPEQAENMQDLLTRAQQTITRKYPAGAKRYLRRAGLSIDPHCRVGCESLTPDELEDLDILREKASQVASR